MAQVQTISHFKVSVWCNTYNQAFYIKDTMDGFCMQQTSFPFVCLIMDDASTDGEPEVIKQYLNDHFDTEWTKETDDYHLTLARHQENKNCFFAVYLLKYNHYSIKKPRLKYYREVTDEIDYVALCEGDDYWTDAHKLQKQADALDANPQATLVYTNFQAIDGEGNPISRPFIKDYVPILVITCRRYSVMATTSWCLPACTAIKSGSPNHTRIAL